MYSYKNTFGSFITCCTLISLLSSLTHSFSFDCILFEWKFTFYSKIATIQPILMEYIAVTLAHGERFWLMAVDATVFVQMRCDSPHFFFSLSPIRTVCDIGCEYRHTIKSTHNEKNVHIKTNAFPYKVSYEIKTFVLVSVSTLIFFYIGIEQVICKPLDFISIRSFFLSLLLHKLHIWVKEKNATIAQI